ncbi:MAG: hypothetical protein J6Q86_04320 [Methanobrevibacter sp.]|nr:hypothetical protein [Methanobrevibacter sp.]
MKSSGFWKTLKEAEIALKGPSLGNENHHLIVSGLSRKNIWMFHEVSHLDIFKFQKIANPDEDCYIWDDAVKSQLKGFRYLDGIHIIAVSPAIAEASQEHENILRYPDWETVPESTSELHKKWFAEGIAYDFMSWNDLDHVLGFGNVAVAMHGYDHRKFNFTLSDENIQKFTEETEKGIELFRKRLGFKPSLYVWPYNEECYWADALLKKKFEMYTIGKGRLDARKAIESVQSN